MSYGNDYKQPYQQPYAQQQAYGAPQDFGQGYTAVPAAPATYYPEATKESSGGNSLFSCLWTFVGLIIATIIGPLSFILACCISDPGLLSGIGLGHLLQAAIAAVFLFVMKYCDNACSTFTDTSVTITLNGRAATTAERVQLQNNCLSVCKYVNYGVIGLVILYVILAIIAFMMAGARVRRNRRGGV